MKNKSFKHLLSLLLVVSMVLHSFSLAFAATPTETSTDLAEPTNLVATSGDSQVNLTWASVTGATYYNVYQSLDGLTYNLISTPASTTYDVTELTNSTLYYFKVSAANTVGESTYSTALSATPSVGPAPVNLGLAGNFAILSKSGISTVPNSAITGNIGVSPINSTAITGFSLTIDATNEFSESTQFTGKAYASDYASPTPSYLTTAVSNMETAYSDAAGRAADYTELYTGDISGQTLTAGVYKWGTGVLINSDVTLHGGPNDVFIFQIAKGITQANGTKIILTGGAQAKNIFWQSSETVSIGTNSHFEGIVLGKTNITMGTNASINGRLFAQTAVTLIKSTVVAPSVEPVAHNYSIATTGNPTLELGHSASYSSQIFDNGIEVFDQSVQWSLRNQDDSTPTMGSITEVTGNSATVNVGSDSSYVNKYLVLSATLTDDPSITIEKLIQIK
ncbi:ice-binding family protein [Paenisporosarcina sp. TG-14]|uniref:ice-binding family protein n=1 Tax=Paenisporosarcina sp. TG-14 TaxID=1231057 RepID=UPI0002DFB02C|nr:ice-binding family protein [Paenisporosarcina sp. TG-14]